MGKLKMLRFLLATGLFTCFFLSRSIAKEIAFDFYGNPFTCEITSTADIPFKSLLTDDAIKLFYSSISHTPYQNLIDSLRQFKERNKLNDWVYYQLIRKTAQSISPKTENYYRYTLYKWFLLTKSGYDARLAIANDKIIFYVFNDEDISDIPFFMVDDRKYMCLNYHDYGKIDFDKEVPIPVSIHVPEATHQFSYKITRLPDFKPEAYVAKDLNFNYRSKVYHFKILENRDVQGIFTNYPVVDFATYFNIPLSKATYSSLIPLLKKNTRGMSEKKGVDYLMRFTRYAFLYQDDERIFGKEKRLSPEQTLFSKYSDCDDRAGLFFYLVKEIYNLPMVALLYPTHITMAVQFEKPVGTGIEYKGKIYSVCEPTPQGRDLKIGQISEHLRNSSYQVVYCYEPAR